MNITMKARLRYAWWWAVHELVCSPVSFVLWRLPRSENWGWADRYSAWTETVGWRRVYAGEAVRRGPLG